MWSILYVLLWLAVRQGSCEDVLQGPQVTVVQGALRGVFLETRGERQVQAFLGIPYAAPPVGPLRFHKPIAAAAWEGVRNATKPGSPCLQHPPPTSNFTKGGVFGNEDCLYLNVYTSKISKDSKTPVLVYIHGGAFVVGSGDHYHPDYLMDKNIVLVTINYRLGVLGFLSMEDKDLPGNYGLKDQTAALRWVRENIAQFGGDANSVTLFGNSAGAASVHYHMLSPLSKGLFHQAISHSGSAYCPWANHAPGQLRIAGERFAHQLGCNYQSTLDALDCLRDMPGYVLVDLLHNLYDWHQDPVVQFPPAIEPTDTEDAFLTQDPWKLSSDVPWITGVTNAEGHFKVRTFDKATITDLNNEFEMIGPLTLLFRTTAEDPVRTAFTVKKYYFFDGDITHESLEELTRMYSDSWFVYPIKESYRRHKGPKYFFYFDYRGSNSAAPDYYGVSHFDDMQYFFPMNSFLENINITAEDQRMSEQLIELWTNFVIHGKPTLESSDVTWNTATLGTEYLHIKKSGFAVEKDLLQARDDFWSTLPYREKYFQGKTVDNTENINKDEL